MSSNYNNAASFYDWLSRLVYGNTLLDAQLFLLHHIAPGSYILLAGGGTGSILDAITRLYPSGLTITYVEISPKMVALSKKRNLGNNKVLFITDSIENIRPDKQYDVIFTPFLLDNFSDEELQPLFRQLADQLKPGGLWLCSDFQLTGKWWQPPLLQSMYWFFKVLGCVQVSNLPAIDSLFTNYRYQVVDRKEFFGTFIKSTVYRSSDPTL